MICKSYEELRNEIIEVYSDEDSTRFDVGKLIDFDENWLLLELYDTYGNRNGISLIREDQIFIINRKTRYIHALTIGQDCDQEISLKHHGDLLTDFIEQIVKQQPIIAWHNESDTVRGKFLKEDEEFLHFEAYLDNGLPDGICMVRKDYIKQISFDTAECKKLTKSIQSKYGLQTV